MIFENNVWLTCLEKISKKNFKVSLDFKSENKINLPFDIQRIEGEKRIVIFT